MTVRTAKNLNARQIKQASSPLLKRLIETKRLNQRLTKDMLLNSSDRKILHSCADEFIVKALSGDKNAFAFLEKYSLEKNNPNTASRQAIIRTAAYSPFGAKKKLLRIILNGARDSDVLIKQTVSFVAAEFAEKGAIEMLPYLNQFAKSTEENTAWFAMQGLEHLAKRGVRETMPALARGLFLASEMSDHARRGLKELLSYKVDVVSYVTRLAEKEKDISKRAYLRDFFRYLASEGNIEAKRALEKFPKIVVVKM